MYNFSPQKGPSSVAKIEAERKFLMKELRSIKTHTNYFTVYPSDCNYMKHLDGTPMVHGGTMLLKMDRAAAELARILLKETECDSALTVGVDRVIFHKGAKLGDMIRIQVNFQEVGIKRMSFYTSCYVENELICEGYYHFCSFKDGKSHGHKLGEKIC